MKPIILLKCCATCYFMNGTNIYDLYCSDDSTEGCGGSSVTLLSYCDNYKEDE
jgi:hypothetical protein